MAHKMRTDEPRRAGDEEPHDHATLLMPTKNGDTNSASAECSRSRGEMISSAAVIGQSKPKLSQRMPQSCCEACSRSVFDDTHDSSARLKKPSAIPTGTQTICGRSPESSTTHDWP